MRPKIQRFSGSTGLLLLWLTVPTVWSADELTPETTAEMGQVRCLL